MSEKILEKADMERILMKQTRKAYAKINLGLERARHLWFVVVRHIFA